ncbi:MAG: GFA family protein [Rhizobacter sp.]
MTTRTYTGSCHCGAVAFRCEVDLAAGTGRCNCSMCRKVRFWRADIAGDALQVLRGESDIAEYRFGSRQVAHCFCRHCGVKVFGRRGVFAAVSVACLDDVSTDELRAAPVRYEDGRHDDWAHAPSDAGVW